MKTGTCPVWFRGAWRCLSCDRGLTWEDRCGRVSSHRCHSCRGSGEGWAPFAVTLVTFTILCLGYYWFCDGMPGAPHWMRPDIGPTPSLESPLRRRQQ